MIKSKQIIDAIDSAETIYNKCWKILVELKTVNQDKNPSEELAKGLPQFQILIAESIFRLERVIHHLHQEKRETIKRKSLLSTQWFKQRLKTLDKYIRAINQTISIGKTLGDSFAWIFYNNERELIGAHARHHKNFHTPHGIGGEGELALLNLITFEGHLIIYHGITSFLHIGDVSLYNLKKKKLTAIGELKTTKTGKDTYQLLLNIVGPKIELDETIKERDIKIDSSNKGAPQLPEDMKKRLQRQIKSMASSFDSQKKEEDQSLSLTTNYNIKELDELFSRFNGNKVAYHRAGDGLLLMGYKNDKVKLSDRILGNKNVNRELKKTKLVAEVAKLLSPQGDNNIGLSSFHYSISSEYFLGYGIEPLFYWPLKLQNIHDIIFGNVLIFSVYNSAHLFNKIKAEGFTVQKKENKYIIRKKLNGSYLELQNFEYFLHLIQHHLFHEDFVMQIINSTIETARQYPPEAKVKVRMDIQQKLTT